MADEPLEVFLNVYDIQQKSSIVRLNTVTRDLGLGGIFHGAIQLGSAEFSFGWCDRGTGVYAVAPTMNPMYQYRESISLGHTSRSMEEIRDIIHALKAAWPGSSYDLLKRNCCHFCEVLAAQLAVDPVPGWLNRFAAGAAATVNLTQETVKTMHEIGAELNRWSGESFGYLKSGWNRTLAAAAAQQQQLAERLQQQQQQQQQRPQVARDVSALDGLDFQALPAGNISGSSSGGHGSNDNSFGLRDRVAPSTSSNSSLASGAAAAGASFLSGLAHARDQVRATTTRLLAQAAAAKGPAAALSREQGWGSTNGSTADLLGQSQTNSTSLPSVPALWQQQQQQQQQQQDQEPAAAALLPAAQPKLAKQYRLSSRHNSSGGGPEECSDPFTCLLEELDDDDDDDGTSDEELEQQLKRGSQVPHQGGTS